MGLLANKSHSDADERVAEVLSRVPAAFAVEPDDATEAQHLAAITAAARDAADTPRPTTKRRNVLTRNRPLIVTARLLAAAVGACALMAALAVAGVTLPGPASDVAKSVGLPNQADDNARGATGLEGAERADEVRQDAAHRQDGERGSSDGAGKGDDVSAENNGRDTGIGDDVSTEAQTLGEGMRNAESDEERRQIAEEFNQQVQTWAKDRSRLPDQAQSAPQNGETESQGDAQTGETRSADGQAIADEHRPDSPGNRP